MGEREGENKREIEKEKRMEISIFYEYVILVFTRTVK